MARRSYGVCGGGMGHESRSKILINYLKKQGHEVKIKDFFKNLKTYRKNMEAYNPEKQEKILKKIEEDILKVVA